MNSNNSSALKDKNGKEIYEGDILGKGLERYVVSFEDGGFGARSRNYGHFLSEFDFVEIIGNIYENPELLK